MIRIINKRILEMDIIRGISIIAVILIHVSAVVIYRTDFASNTYKAAIIINQISRFSVPAFILISGMGLTLSFKKDEGYFNFIKRRFNKIIPSYVLWSMIYIYYTTRNFEIGNVINNIVFGSSFYQLYYIPIIVEFYLAYPLIYKFIGTKRGVFVSLILTLGMIIVTRYHIVPNKLAWFFDKKNLLNWIFYFSMGSFISKNIEQVLKYAKKYKNLIISFFLVSTCILVFDCVNTLKTSKNIDYSVNFIRPTVFIYSIFFVLLIFAIKWKKSIFISTIKYISKISYSIYLSHAIILDCLVKYYSKNSLIIVSPIFEIKAFFITIIGAIFINEMKKYL